MTSGLEEDVRRLVAGAKEEFNLRGSIHVFDTAEGRSAPLSAEDEARLAEECAEQRTPLV